MLSKESFISVENLGDEPFHYSVHGRDILIPPHSPMPIPWEHMMAIAGDPFSNDTDRTNLRSDEVERLRNYHGIYSDETKWANRRPLRFVDQEGDEVPTPYTHPDGIGAETSTDPADLNYLVNRMKRNEAENAALKLQMAQMQAQQDALASSHLTTDAPVNVPEGDISSGGGHIPDPARPATLDLPSTPPTRKRGAVTNAPAEDPVTADTPTRVKTS